MQSSGSDFYHAHIGAQRTMGMYGPISIKSRPASTEIKRDPIVDFEYSMTVNDWNHNYDSLTALLKITNGAYDTGSLTPYQPFNAPDGSRYPPFVWHSGLINGKGRYRDESGDHNNAPLETFSITENSTARFRVIGTGTIFPLRVSIQNHDLTMISSDGYRFQDQVVESFVISPGERMDFKVEGTQPAGCYWIYAETLEVNLTTGNPPFPRHRAEAILQYEGNGLSGTNYDNDACFADPEFIQRRCTTEQPCNVLNCPFDAYKSDANINCIHLTNLTSLEWGYDRSVKPNEEFEEDRFFNFAIIKGQSGETFRSINGRKWFHAPLSPASQSSELKEDYCTAEACNKETDACECTNYQNLEHNKQYQFIFTGLGNGVNPSHPVHLHGHGFQLVYQGFATINDSTGISTMVNDDLQCEGESEDTSQSELNCNNPRWKNNATRQHVLSNLSYRPVKKDTIAIPVGGYAVVRFRANSPGFWFMHCHIEIHNIAGMAMMFNEGSSMQVDAPKDFPQCRNFPTEFPPITRENTENPRPTVDDGENSSARSYPTIGLLPLVLLFSFYQSS